MKTIDITKDTTIYKEPKDNEDIIYNVFDNAKLLVYDYNYDSSKKVEVNLNSEYSSIEYHYSSRNINNNNFIISINHNKSNTSSNLYNHVINKDCNTFVLDVSSKVNKDCSKCICNQDNQIINLNDGKGIILPNLLIDNYDVESSHSAYIGSFKEDSIYYLMSRGISREKSIDLLTKSFLINGGNQDIEIVKEYIGDING